MAILTQPIPRPNTDKPRRVLIAEDLGTDADTLDAHIAAAIEPENVTIRARNRGKPPAEQTPELTSGLLDGFHRSTVRGLVNHVRTLTEPADLTAWRRAWPKVFVPLSDEEASAVIRAAEAMAHDERVMPEHFPRARPVAGAIRPGSAMGAAAGPRATGPGVPIKVNRGAG